ncbi:MAG: cyanophycinase [Pyrinomonadaceae bacterium]
MNRSIVIAFIVLCAAISALSQQRLMLAGGGKRPTEAIRKFVDWSGGNKAKILVITWASGVPGESFAAITEDFSAFKTASIENAPIAPIGTYERIKLIDQVKNATGIFFTGGDQNRIMDVFKDAELLKIVREKYSKGTPIGGTSAGTAVMSDPMITGEADLKIIDGSKVGTRPGVGLLPGTILDQHFIQRQRENRLFGLVMKHPSKLGVGIDEDTVLMVENNRIADVIGETQVMFVDAKDRNGALLIHLVKAGDSFDLQKRRPLAKANAARP